MNQSILVLSTALLLSAPFATAKTFSPELEVYGQELLLNGEGILKFKGLIRVYDAALYLPPDVAPLEANRSEARRLEVVYRVNVKAERFTNAGDKLLEELLTEEEMVSLRDRIDQINRLFPDHSKGDRCALTYIPGVGTKVTYNGKHLGTIPGEDFARAYFSIWLGETPASERLKEDLLFGGAKWDSRRN